MEDFSTQFYNNVDLLSQIEPSSLKFQELFQSQMFDKQNTPGFIHVSQFLFNIYDPEYFKKNVSWPLYNKQDEATYRKSAVDFICKIKNENPDLEFPQIMPTYFVHASGTKFITIMFKLSSAVMRAYLKKQDPNKCFLLCPNPFIPESQISAEKLVGYLDKSTEKEMEEILNDATTAQEEAHQFLESTKSQIVDMEFKIKEAQNELKEVVDKTTIDNPEYKAKLLDPNKYKKILSMWDECIKNDVERINRKAKYVNEVYCLTEHVKNVFLSITNNGHVLDGDELPKLDTKKLAQVLPAEIKVHLDTLYDDGKLNLYSYFIIFSSFLNNCFESCIENNGIDFTSLSQQFKASSEDMDKLKKIQEEQKERCLKLIAEVEESFLKLSVKNHPTKVDWNDSILMSSPLVSLKTRPTKEDDVRHLKQVELTPTKDQPRLFTKYNSARKMNSELKLPNATISRINVDDLQFAKPPSPKLQCRKVVPKTPWTTSAKMKKYSKIFETVKVSKKKEVTADMSQSCLVPPKASSIAMNSIPEEELTFGRAETSFLSSTKLQTPPKKNCEKRLSLLEEEKTQVEVNQISDVASSILYPATSSSESVIKSEVPQEKKSHRRGSFGDLIERYRQITSTSKQTEVKF